MLNHKHRFTQLLQGIDCSQRFTFDELIALLTVNAEEVESSEVIHNWIKDQLGQTIFANDDDLLTVKLKELHE